MGLAAEKWNMDIIAIIGTKRGSSSENQRLKLNTKPTRTITEQTTKYKTEIGENQNNITVKLKCDQNQILTFIKQIEM